MCLLWSGSGRIYKHIGCIKRRMHSGRRRRSYDNKTNMSLSEKIGTEVRNIMRCGNGLVFGIEIIWSIFEWTQWPKDKGGKSNENRPHFWSHMIYSIGNKLSILFVDVVTAFWGCSTRHHLVDYNIHVFLAFRYFHLAFHFHQIDPKPSYV